MLVPHFLKWLIVGIILGIVAGLAALIFYFTLKLMEYLFMNLLVGIELPESLGEGFI
jgi:CIC family chloride channel protein